MTVTAYDLLLYAGGMAALWAVPGPVWVALTARALSGGMAGAWPLAVGVALGDLIWPLAAILGLTWIESAWGDYLAALRWVAAGIFIAMGVMLIRKPAATMNADSRLTRPGLWAGFSVGVAAVIGNPKAILFFTAVLPPFMDVTRPAAPQLALFALATIGMDVLTMSAYGLGGAALARRMNEPRFRTGFALLTGLLLLAAAVLIVSRL